MSARQPMRQLVAYLTVLAGPEPAGRYLELRYRTDRGMRQRFTDAAQPTEAAAAIVALACTRDVYIGCAPRRRRAGGKDAIAEAWTLWVDCDTPAAIGALADFSPQPAIVIRSGRGLHAYWPLAAPLASGPLERANRRLAHRLGACQSAVTNAAALLRPPASTSYKYAPPRPVVLARFTGERFTTDVVVGGLADPPHRARPPRPPRARPRRSDPLLAIEPAVYVEALTGRRVGRDGKVACPLHPDERPSLHAYPDPADGWTCYSARCWRGDRPNGGDVYTLAAQLWGLSTQADFRELRDRLRELLLPAGATHGKATAARVPASDLSNPRPPRSAAPRRQLPARAAAPPSASHSGATAPAGSDETTSNRPTTTPHHDGD
jgi:hypothetical protein